MDITTIFLIGMLLGLVISFIQPNRHNEEPSPVVDAIFGMMGALLIGGAIAQFIHGSSLVVVTIIIGALIFIEIGRAMPKLY